MLSELHRKTWSKLLLAGVGSAVPKREERAGEGSVAGEDLQLQVNP